jgi:hypothetical protein
MIDKDRALTWIARDEGSTRVVALIRLGLPLLLICNYAYRFQWWRALPGGQGDPVTWAEAYANLGFGVVFLASTVSLFLGFWSRTSAAISGLTQITMIGVMQGVFEQVHWAHHYTQLMAIATLLLVVSPSGRSLSLDRWRALNRGEALPERAPLTGQRLIAMLMSSMYFWAVIDKLRPGFLSGDDIERFFLVYYLDSDYPAGALFPLACAVFAWATVVFEVFLTFGLWTRRWRPLLVVTGALFHAVFFFALQVYTFSLTCTLLYLAFFDADEVHAAIDRMLGKSD